MDGQCWQISCCSFATGHVWTLGHDLFSCMLTVQSCTAAEACICITQGPGQAWGCKSQKWPYLTFEFWEMCWGGIPQATDALYPPTNYRGLCWSSEKDSWCWCVYQPQELADTSVTISCHFYRSLSEGTIFTEGAVSPSIPQSKNCTTQAGPWGY